MIRRRFMALAFAAIVSMHVPQLGWFEGEVMSTERMHAAIERRFAVIYAQELERYIMEGDRTVPAPRGFLSATGGVA